MSLAQSITKALGGEWRGHRGYCPTPGHGPRDRGTVIMDADKADDVFVRCYNADSLEVKRELRDRGLLPPLNGRSADWKPRALTRPERPPAPRRDPQSIGAALAAWDAARPVPGTLAACYLARRGITAVGGLEHVLRYHPAAKPAGRWNGPAMLTLARDVLTGKPAGLQATMLSPDGAKLARLYQGSPGGVVAMLTPDEDVALSLGLCEGVEDGLAIRQAESWRPLWATFGTGNLERFPVVPGVELLSVYADNDPGGLRAAEIVARRWAEAGRTAEVHVPPVKDFNAIVQEAAHG